jgi:hypothetical protein
MSPSPFMQGRLTIDDKDVFATLGDLLDFYSRTPLAGAPLRGVHASARSGSLAGSHARPAVVAAAPQSAYSHLPPGSASAYDRLNLPAASHAASSAASAPTYEVMDSLKQVQLGGASGGYQTLERRSSGGSEPQDRRSRANPLYQPAPMAPPSHGSAPPLPSRPGAGYREDVSAVYETVSDSHYSSLPPPVPAKGSPMMQHQEALYTAMEAPRASAPPPRPKSAKPWAGPQEDYDVHSSVPPSKGWVPSEDARL